jgi:hypothetical protein
MKHFIELGAVRMGAVIQNACATIDAEVLTLPGGCLIAVLLWLSATAKGSMRRTAAQVRAFGSKIDARAITFESLPQTNGACVGCGC